MNSLVNSTVEEEQGRDNDGPTCPIFYDLICFYKAPADAYISSDFTETFCVCQGNTRRVELALRLLTPSCKHFVIFKMPSVLES